jgi:uncharacterized membrane protein YfcA
MPLTLTTVLLLVLGGLAIGASLGLFGGGGTLLALPLLVALGVAPKPAIAASLLVVAATAAVAGAAHLRAGNVDWRATALFAPASMLAAYAAGRIAERMHDDALVLIFAALVVTSAGAMLRRPSQQKASSTAPSAPLLAAVGALGGALSGLVGAGGGTLYVPALALLAGLPIRQAIGTSLIVIVLVATSALLGHLGHVDLPAGIAGIVGGAAAAGAWLGQKLSRRSPERALRTALALVLIAVAGWLLTRESHIAAWLQRPPAQGAATGGAIS